MKIFRLRSSQTLNSESPRSLTSWTSRCFHSTLHLKIKREYKHDELCVCVIIYCLQYYTCVVTHLAVSRHTNTVKICGEIKRQDAIIPLTRSLLHFTELLRFLNGSRTSERELSALMTRFASVTRSVERTSSGTKFVWWSRRTESAVAHWNLFTYL